MPADYGPPGGALLAAPGPAPAPATPGRDRPLLRCFRVQYRNAVAVRAFRPAACAVRPEFGAAIWPALRTGRPLLRAERPALRAGRPVLAAVGPGLWARGAALRGGGTAVSAVRPGIWARGATLRGGGPALAAVRPALWACGAALRGGAPVVSAVCPAFWSGGPGPAVSGPVSRVPARRRFPAHPRPVAALARPSGAVRRSVPGGVLARLFPATAGRHARVWPCPVQVVCPDRIWWPLT